MIPAEDRWIALGSEGGHVSFAPCDQREMDVLSFAWRELSHVSAERLASGRGLELIYRALSERAGKPDAPPLLAADITSRALNNECDVCIEAVDCFCAILGSIAGNVAMTLGALGGIYIGGGIVPRLGPLFEQSQFPRPLRTEGPPERIPGADPHFPDHGRTAYFSGHRRHPGAKAQARPFRRTRARIGAPGARAHEPIGMQGGRLGAEGAERHAHLADRRNRPEGRREPADRDALLPLDRACRAWPTSN